MWHPLESTLSESGSVLSLFGHGYSNSVVLGFLMFLYEISACYCLNLLRNSHTYCTDSPNSARLNAV